MPGMKEEVNVRLVNEKVQFIGVSPANPERPLTFDYAPPMGDGAGFNGLELLLMSLSGCSATAVVYLLRKMRKTVSGFEVQAEGIRKETHPIKFEKITLRFILKSPDAKEEDIQKAVQLTEETYCPVWQMIKNNVDVIPEYTIVRD